MCRGWSLLFGPRRSPDEPPELARFADVAAGLQRRTEDALFWRSRDDWLAPPASATWSTPAELPSTVSSNARLERDGPFRSLFVSLEQPMMPARRSVRPLPSRTETARLAMTEDV